MIEYKFIFVQSKVWNMLVSVLRNQIIPFKTLFLIMIFLSLHGVSSRDLSSIHPVKEKINELYRRSSQLNSAQLYALEIKLAESLLKEIQSIHPKDFQKSINQVKKVAIQTLYLYKKGYSRLKDKIEKSKLLFRMGYLYEIVGLDRDALGTYKKIIALKLPAQKTQEARTLYNRVRKRIQQSSLSHSASKNSLLQSILIQTKKDIENQKWSQALISFEKSCQVYLAQQSCSYAGCSHSPRVIKDLIHLAHQRSEDGAIIKMYRIYLSYFPLDFAIVLSAAEWAAQKDDFVQALDFYQRYILFRKHTIQSAYREGKQKDLKKQNDQWVDLESIFHLYHSVAQLSQNPKLEIQAYDFYLKNSVLKKSAFKIEYLKNKVLFQLQEFYSVAPFFREIVLYPHTRLSLKEEAASLALQSVLKIGKKIVARKWSHEFSLILPHKKEEFQKLLSS